MSTREVITPIPRHQPRAAAPVKTLPEGGSQGPCMEGKPLGIVEEKFGERPKRVTFAEAMKSLHKPAP